MGGKIAQLNWTIDSAGEHYLKMLTDFPRGKVYLITSERLRRWRIALETQDPEVNVAGYNGAGTPTIYTACIDPLTGHILMQAQPGGPNAIPIRKFDHDTGAVIGTFGGVGTFPSWPTSLWGNSYIRCVQAGAQSYIVGLEGQTRKGFVVNATTMTATSFYQTIPASGGFLPSTNITAGASGPGGGVVYFTDPGSGVPNALTIFQIAISSAGVITQNTIGTVPAATFDSPNVIPAYTQITLQTMAYDQTDGNLLVMLRLYNDKWTSVYYHAKISTTDAHVIWYFPLLAGPITFPAADPGQIPPGTVAPPAVGGVVPGTAPSGSPAITVIATTPGMPAQSVSAPTIGMAAGGFGILNSANGSFTSLSDNLSGLSLNGPAQLTGDNLSGWSSVPTPDGTMFIGMGGYTRGGSSPVPVAGTPDSITGPYGFFIVKPEVDDTPVAFGCDPRTSASLTASWTPVAGYDAYNVAWRHAGSSGPWSGRLMTTRDTGGVSSITVTGLDFGIDYEWRVSVYGDAFTTHGWSNVITCPAPPAPVIPPPPPQWEITSKFSEPGEGGIGDLWMDQRYVDFSNLAMRRKFISADKMWVDPGYYGEKPLGTSPRVWNTVHTGYTPRDFTYGYGQDGAANRWNLFFSGNDPTTGQFYPYPYMAFDDCIAPPEKQPVMMLL